MNTPSRWGLRALALLLPLSSAARAQEPEPQPAPQSDEKPDAPPFFGNPGLGGGEPARRVVIDGQRLDVRRARLDPWGHIDVEAIGPDGVLELELEFAPFSLPWSVERDLPPLEGAVTDAEADAVASFSLRLSDEAVGWTAAHLRFSCTRGGRFAMKAEGKRGGVEFPIEVEVDLDVARLEEPEIVGAPEHVQRARLSAAGSADDLVICAVGNTGTGLPGAVEVAEAMTSTANAYEADFCVLLGDIVGSGAAAVGSEPWRECVETLFPAGAFGGPIHLVLGDLDHRGKVGAYAVAQQADARWRHDRVAYDFVVDCHGKKVLCVVADTTSMFGDVSHPQTRFTRRHLQGVLEQEADWKIVFGHHPLVMSGRGSDDRDREELRRFCQLVQKADVYVSGGDHHLEITEAIDGVVHVNAGGGGGADTAASATWQPHTRFAATGGGFAWLRCTGNTLEIVLRGADGRPLFGDTLKRKGS